MLRAFWFVLVVALATPAAGGAEAERVRDVVYGRAAGMALTLDVLRPAEPNGVGVLFMVSGGFNSDITLVGQGFFPLSLFDPFLERGQTVFLVAHGSQPKFTVGEIVPMVRRAVRYVRAHAADYGVDSERLGVMGVSSGGFLSLTLGTTGDGGDPSANDEIDRVSSEVQAIACFCPPSDLVDYGEPGRTLLEFKPVEFVWHTIGVQGRPRGEQIHVLRELSPLTYVTADDAPTLIIHGDEDELVPFEQSQRFVAELEDRGVTAKLITREGAGHVWPTMPADFALLAEWFDEHLVTEAVGASAE